MVRIELNGNLLATVDESQEIETTKKESDLEYYLNRKGMFYFRNSFRKISILSQELSEFMKNSKYGDKFSFNYD